MKEKKQEFRMNAAEFDRIMRGAFQVAPPKKAKGRRKKSARKV